MNAAIVFSALKTKCGSICACNAVVVADVSSDSWSCAESCVAQRLERLDGGLVERRAGRREGDHGAGRPVVQAQRHDRRGAERARRMTALGTQAERCEQRPVLCERLVHGPDRLVAGGVMVGARADERKHLCVSVTATAP